MKSGIQPLTISVAAGLAWVVTCLLAPGYPASCLNYDEEVSISGHLERRTYPGRPNYESIAEGDEAEVHFYVKLDAPVCTNEGTKPYDDARRDVDMIQLVLDEAGYRALRPLLGNRVTLTGYLYGSFSAHHHARLLLQAPKMKP